MVSHNVSELRSTAALALASKQLDSAAPLTLRSNASERVSEGARVAELSRARSPLPSAREAALV